MFDPVDPKQSFPDLERGILTYWREEDLFHRSIELRKDAEEFTFYDGPPFATGLPHYGHLLAGTIKDVIPRYQTMRGKKVQRRFGWDCHGLPIENLIEKEHNIKTKQEIEAMSVRKFNELCRGSVQRYAKEWRNTVERVGRWVDMDWDYRTMDATFMESIWWVFKSLYDKSLIYEGHKPMHICPRCVTPLSNFEVTQGYKDVTDQTAIVMFELVEKMQNKGKTFLLAWTTTPWTLPGNLFVAVGADIDYVAVIFENNTYIVAQDRAESVFKDKECVQIETFKGSTLVGKHYVPLFPYYADAYPTAFRVVSGDFVTTADGTGLVHIAPGFGEDDFRVGEKEGVPLLQHINMEGVFLPPVKDFAGQQVKPIDDPSKTDRKIIEWLEEHSKLFAKENYRHSYPHCWRCDSPLLNYATSSWFVRVEKIKQDMLDVNAKTEWVPAHIRDGRFGNWLENARDWAISRNRYWGTPLPIWRCEETGDIEVVGSRDALMQRSLLRFSKITMIRHGQAEHNIGHFYQSQIPGVDLTDMGKKQAETAGEFLATQNVSLIYCSPLLRTRQTAEAIADATGARVVVDERLREIDVGEYEGKAFDVSDLTLMKLKRQKKLQDGSPESMYHLEGMEKWTDVEKRVANFFDDIIPMHRSEHIVVVTHADPVLCGRHYFTKEDPFKLSHQPFPSFATAESYFWDHDTNQSMDLHKENVDEIAWSVRSTENAIELVCVRHGETDWNLESKVQGGNADRPLNDTGRAQAKELAGKLNGQTFDCIISSDMQRAVETAEILSKELGIPFTEQYELLRERNLGEWSGKTRAEIDVTAIQGYAFHYATPKEGETLSAFMKRLQAAYEELLKDFAGKRVLMVSHRGVMCGLRSLAENLSYQEALNLDIPNGSEFTISLQPLYKRIPEVLDCWFESGSMPYAQQHFPFEQSHHQLGVLAAGAENGRAAVGESSSDAHLPHEITGVPPRFPADFIAEGIDQTRGWFYTLTVLSAALYKEPAFKNCVVNGIVLAEDGRKMSKRLKNYPEPTEVIEKYSADALRFTLMSSPAVRGEDLRFSEKMAEETLRNVLLPLWNSYSFFVTYANIAKFEPVALPKQSAHPLDKWIKAEVQDLINRMTEQLDNYDLSATCEELFETIDGLTNWYIRLSRRRFAGKGMVGDTQEAEPENFEQDRMDAFNTLYNVLLSISQVLAPFCPFITDAIYINLVSDKHGSVHLTDWPAVRTLEKDELGLISANRFLRRVVSLGLKIRSDKKVKIRTPLQKVTVAFHQASMAGMDISPDMLDIIRQELNVKEVAFVTDPGLIAETYVQVDARKAGPRLGRRVQEVIQAAKSGKFEILDDGRIAVLDEILDPDEATIMYRGAEGKDVAGEHGVVVSLDTAVTKELELEGLARDLIREIQKLRKEQGYNLGERLEVGITGAGEILAVHKSLLESETSVIITGKKGDTHTVEVGETSITIFMDPKA